jgi:hypothetical protein
VIGKAIASAAALGLLPLAAANSCEGPLNPCPKMGNDICFYPKDSVLETQYVEGHGNHRFVYVEAWLTVQVNVRPKALHISAALQWWDKYSVEPHWANEDVKSYGLHNLPEADGKKHRVNPRLEDSCTPGRWRIYIVYSGKASDGTVVPPRKFWIPGPLESSQGKRFRCHPPA